MEKYNLDSCKMLFRIIYKYNNSKPNKFIFLIYNQSKILYGSKNIIHMNKLVFRRCGNIRNRITIVNIITKGIYLLIDRVLNNIKIFGKIYGIIY